MECIIGAKTDVGIVKDTNQDAIALRIANINGEKVIFGILCDGMGGLESGEVASSSLIVAFITWFEGQLPIMLASGFHEDLLHKQWKSLVVNSNAKLMQYGRERGIHLGTTLVAVLVYQGRYYVMNIGDSRLYLIQDKVTQVTKDQTYVQREMDMGRMTLEEAKESESRNVLLQCIGATELIYPDYYAGDIIGETIFVLCSDGFRHVVTEQELYQYLNGSVNHSSEQVEQNIEMLIRLNKSRGEEDNITAGMIKVW